MSKSPLSEPWSLDDFIKLDPQDDKVLIRGRVFREVCYLLSTSQARMAVQAVNEGTHALKGSRPLTYLACPYTHPDKSIRELRFTIVNKVAAILISQGHIVFSPISHSHPIHCDGIELGSDWEQWKHFDEIYISLSSLFLVLTIDSWEKSVGVQAEMRIAQEQGIPIGFVDTEGKVRMSEGILSDWIENIQLPAVPSGPIDLTVWSK